MKIYAPVKTSNGVWATVRFVNGVGETDNPKLIKWFKERGYKVVDETDQTNQRVEHITTTQVTEPVGDVGDVNQPNFSDSADSAESANSTEYPAFESMNPNELRDWCKTNGLGAEIKNTRNKEKLLEIINNR